MPYAHLGYLWLFRVKTIYPTASLQGNFEWKNVSQFYVHNYRMLLKSSRYMRKSMGAKTRREGFMYKFFIESS